jgi:hypothetical protein
VPFTSYGTRRVPTTSEKRRTGKLFPARSSGPERQGLVQEFAIQRLGLCFRVP